MKNDTLIILAVIVAAWLLLSNNKPVSPKPYTKPELYLGKDKVWHPVET